MTTEAPPQTPAEAPPQTPAEAPPQTPAPKKRRSPYRRAVMLALLAMTLPLPWAEKSSCQGNTTILTGIDVMSDPPAALLPLGLIFGGPVLFGLMQPGIRRALAGLALEVLSLMLSGLGGFYCLVHAVLGNALQRNYYVAPWIAFVAPLLMAIDAIQGIFERIGQWIEERNAPQGGPPA